MSDFENYISLTRCKHISRKGLVVEINRFKNKVKYQTGYPIIKSKYGYGYVLNS